ncbi:translation initiation factor IF-2 [Trichothermofontia sichuanensis B231]|uniref:translation initiation factor IF-2 n=1 Tax=Trichothermofontia sichuanensis TaxID=3045816 RepID=UPI002246CEA6|nr:translation initiation factor IF-2 [Trichothermofontia sichuanensis]UZQ53404.1 translation initiation factor IF-2 [Trichothermofontia sichuanensis B231]
MNNGKVRIYELSKELNLDNKELLAVCERLNIAVKSHSSTISELDAQRIREVAAEMYPSGHPVAKPSAHRKPEHKSLRVPAPTPPKKQEIVGLRPSPSPRSSVKPTHEGPVATPPQGRMAPPSPSPLSSPPARPVHPSMSSAPTLPEVRPPQVPETAAVAVQEARPVETPLTPPPPSPPAPPPQLERPALLEPPSRETLKSVTTPAAPPPPTESTAVASPVPPTPPGPPVEPLAPPPKLVERPTLKRPKSQPAAPSATVASGATTTLPPSRPKAGPRPMAKEAAAGAKPPAPPKTQTIVELRRPPQRPAPEVEKEKSVTVETSDLVTEVDEVPIVELMRPTPPRVKRTKRRDEEDDDETLEKEKPAPKSKHKRRQTLLDDDEDDFGLVDDSEIPTVTAAQVSLSLARPPKPKSMQQAQAKPVTTAQKTRRPNRGGGSGGSGARERSAEVKPERPERITLSGNLTVQELASLLKVPDTEIVKRLFFQGLAATITQTLDVATARMVAEELGVQVETAVQEVAARKVTEMLDAADLDNLQRRPPVVTIMGHVDHGKTTLLDSIRKTKVAQGEAGGITQHIGAYHVDVEHDGKREQIVFLDTPGHEAFTAMRARGARVTDIAILVVAADDGVRPQTIEALRHAQAAGVPIIVAINKIDKEEAQPDRVKQELTEYGLVAEEWGGDTIMTPVSALTGENLDTLLEMILLVAEVEELVANPNRPAKGTVIEAHLDKAKGPVATLLVQNGTLRVGDTVVAGSVLGKVRAMVDDRGNRVKEASPSFAVEILGLNDVPAAGDEFEVFTDEKQARALVEERLVNQRQTRLQQALSSRRVTLNSLSARAQEGELKELNLILKADVQGSVEAIVGALKQLLQNEVQVRLLLAAPGEITETDVDLAAASGAVIVGFNTTLASGARQAADQAGVDVREYDIIYKLLEDIQGAMEGLLEPELVEEPLGQAQVRAVFPVGRGAVAGCYVQSGKLVRNCQIRVHRGNTVVYEGTLDSLRRVKEDVKEVNSGYECGIGVDNFSTWEEGDIIEAFRMVTKRRTLSG